MNRCNNLSKDSYNPHDSQEIFDSEAVNLLVVALRHRFHRMKFRNPRTLHEKKKSKTCFKTNNFPFP